MSVSKETVDDLRNQLKLTRNKIAFLTSVPGIDSKEMTVECFVSVLESAYYRPDALR